MIVTKKKAGSSWFKQEYEKMLKPVTYSLVPLIEKLVLLIIYELSLT